MTAFHGLQHHSPSSLNLAAAALPLFFLEKVLGKRSPASAAMYRGIAAEAGIVHGLLYPAATIDECQRIGMDRYDSSLALSSDPRREKEREAIPGLIEQGVLALRPYGIPDEVQCKIECVVPGVTLPFVGYCDVGWSYHGIRLDIKTQLALASEASSPHRRQVAYYIQGTNLEGRLAYITPKKFGVYMVHMPQEDMAALVQIAMRVERFLSLSTDPNELSALLIPDYGSFYMSNPVVRALAKEVFGF